jgi:hypothetical protein
MTPTDEGTMPVLRMPRNTDSDRRVILTGSNPGVRLYDEDGRVTAFASVWIVDWSVRGSGTAVVLWYDDRVRVISEDLDLAAWLERYFVRSFLEVKGLEWPEPHFERDMVEVRLDLADGLTAKAADVQIELGGVLDRRMFATDCLLLDGVEHSVSLLIAPVRSARIGIGGRTVPGFVHVHGTRRRPSSSAFLTTSEVWRR